MSTVMATLDDRLLGEKLHYYCSSSEDEDDDDDDDKEEKDSGPTEATNIPTPDTDLHAWEGTATNVSDKPCVLNT